MKTRTATMSSLIVLAFVLFAVGAYSSLIWTACGTDGVSSFVQDVRDYHTRAGC